MPRGTAYDRVERVGEFLYVRLDTGRRVSFWDSMRQAESGWRKVARWLSRVNKTAQTDLDFERYEWLLDDVEALLQVHRNELEKKRGKKTKEERIALLRNTSGRDPEEAALYHAKADELERKMQGEG